MYIWARVQLVMLPVSTKHMKPRSAMARVTGALLPMSGPRARMRLARARRQGSLRRVTEDFRPRNVMLAGSMSPETPSQGSP